MALFDKHKFLEKHSLILTVYSVVVAIGGIVETLLFTSKHY